MRANRTLYDEDFYAWSNQQAALLRAGKLDQADIENIAEEIESMGKSERRELVSRLRVLMLHLLKWRFQPLRQTASWRASITIQRREIADHLSDNPSLKAQIDDIIARAYRLAILEGSAETRLPLQTFPVICPWTFSEMMSEDFWPE